MIRKINSVFVPPEDTSSMRKIATRYAFAVVVVLLAFMLGIVLRKLGPMPLFITFYPAVLLVAMVAGGGPGIVATILSGLTSFYFIPVSYGQWTNYLTADALALAVFLVINLSLCALAERQRRSRWIEAFGLAKQLESEELAKKNEELAQQAEELSQQSEELAQQNEELQSQSEEIQTLNTELMGREEMLRKLLEAARLHSAEESVLKDICAAGKDIFGPSVSAVVICERQGDELSILAQAGSSGTPGRWPIEGAFPELVMREGRTACLNDAALRPDLKLLRVVGMDPFQSALSSPLHVGGELFGAVTVYSCHKQEWTTEQFRLVEWLATQCGHILETLRLQDQLRLTAEQNRRLSDLLERSEQPFGIGYPDGTLGYINAAFERLTGYSRKELQGMDWANVLTPPQWRSLEKAKLEELHLTGHPVRYEKEYVRKDGTTVPIELLVHLVLDEQGLPLNYYSFITDISERKRAEEGIRRSEARWNAAVEHLGEGVIIATETGQVIYWNPAARAMHGFTSETEGIGPLKETPNTFQLWTPDGSRMLALEEWPMPRIMRGETVRQVELRLRRPDQGWERFVSYSGDMVETAGGERLVYLSVYDLTEQRKAEQALRENEQRFRMALRNAPVAVAVQDRDLRYIWAYNQRTARPEDIIGNLDSDIFTPEESARMTAMKRRVLAENTELREQMWLERPTGRIFLDICWEPIRDEAGKAIGVGSATVDLTRLKLAEETLARSNDELERRVSERTTELAQRAAQLRALAGELTLSEQRERSRLAKVLHDHIQQLLVAAKFRLAILGKGIEDLMREAIEEVEELIDESIAASRSLTAELSPPILHEAGLDAGLEWLARRMSDKQGLLVDLEMERIAALPDDLKIMLFESVRELLFNIVKHAHTRSSAVNLRRVDGFLQLTVSDEGAGFDPNAISRAGESGRGFGLFSIRERLELFGGKLEVRSAPGQGTRIYISVPVSEPATVEPDPAKAAALPGMHISKQALAPVPDKKIRILLADDHVVVRQGMEAMLSAEADFEVVGGAADGQEAVELARTLMPDAILMDMSMPVLNGIEATRIISRESPNIRIIGLSMFEDSERAQAMRDAGAANYLTKSGPAGELVNAIRTAVRRSREALSAETC